MAGNDKELEPGEKIYAWWKMSNFLNIFFKIMTIFQNKGTVHCLPFKIESGERIKL